MSICKVNEYQLQLFDVSALLYSSSRGKLFWISVKPRPLNSSHCECYFGQKEAEVKVGYNKLLKFSQMLLHIVYFESFGWKQEQEDR